MNYGFFLPVASGSGRNIGEYLDRIWMTNVADRIHSANNLLAAKK
jgi:hypothetical protein